MIEGGLQTFGVACGQLVGYGFYFVKGIKIREKGRMIVLTCLQDKPNGEHPWAFSYSQRFWSLFSSTFSPKALDGSSSMDLSPKRLTICASYEDFQKMIQSSWKNATASLHLSKHKQKWNHFPTRSFSRMARQKPSTVLLLVCLSKVHSSCQGSTWFRLMPTRSCKNLSTSLLACPTLLLPWAVSSTLSARSPRSFLSRVSAVASRSYGLHSEWAFASASLVVFAALPIERTS